MLADEDERMTPGNRGWRTMRYSDLLQKELLDGTVYITANYSLGECGALPGTFSKCNFE